MQAPPQFQQGGYIKPILLPDIIIGILLTTGIAFVNEISHDVLHFANSFLGKVILFVILIYFLYNDKWILALLLILFILRLFRLEQNVIKEPFISEMIVDDVDKKDKWLVEEILGENPTKIKDKIIEFEAIQ
jgi:fumarate reductase subunit D